MPCSTPGEKNQLHLLRQLLSCSWDGPDSPSVMRLHEMHISLGCDRSPTQLLDLLQKYFYDAVCVNSYSLFPVPRSRLLQEVY
ncbi:MAG: hypothetical protein AB1589_29000 [Cyanobacteriota bacterium]